MFRNILGRYRRKWIHLVTSQAPKVNSHPIFVLGKEKSGTTAIAALLATYSGSPATLDIPPFWGQTERAIFAGSMTLSDFINDNSGFFSNAIIKEPGFTFIYGHLKKRFPNAHYIMIVRDARDNIRSVLNRLGVRGDMDDLDSHAIDLIPYEWRIVIDSRWLGIRGDTYIELAAARWNYAVDVYLQNRQDMILVRYEDFVANKLDVIYDIASRLNLPLVNDIDTVVNVQFQPKGNNATSWDEFFGPSNLNRINDICGSRMEKLGYE